MASELSVENPCKNNCGKTSGKILGRGMCGACYQKIRTAEKAKDKEMDFSDLDSPNDHESTSETEDEFTEDLNGSSEIRPGSYPNPSMSQDGSEEKKETPGSIGGKFREMLFGSGNTETISQQKAPLTKERRPGGSAKRVSGSEFIGSAWEILGGFVSRYPRHRPSGLMLQFQSQAAGEILDEAIKGTFVDRIALQKLVRAKGTLDSISSVLLPPVLVFAIEMNPDRAQMLMPMLYSSIKNSLPKMVAPVKKARKKAEEEAEAIRQLFPELADGVDPIQSIMDQIFEGWYSTEPNQDQEQGAQL